MNNHTKKLLVLSGSNGVKDIIKYARSKGIITYATDYYINKGDKLLADAYFNVSTSDIEGILELAKKLDVDGLTTGTSEASMFTVMKVTEELDLPFYTSDDTLAWVNNKKTFKQLLVENNLPVIPDYSQEYVLQNDIYPVVVKPVDSSGAKGISICHTKAEFQRACEIALSFSRTKSLLVEKYMDIEGIDEVFFNYTIVDGKFSLSCGFDLFRYRQNRQSIPLPVRYDFPTKYLSLFEENYSERVIRMLQQIGVKNGTISVQCFCDREDFYIYEAGYRLGGAQSYIFTEFNNNVNALHMMVDFALFGKMTDDPDWYLKDNPEFRIPCAQINIPLRAGKIHNATPIASLYNLNGVLNVTQNKFIGDEIKEDGSLGQLFLRVHVFGMTKEELNSNIELVMSTISAKDIFGNDMIIKQIS